ncbi:MAG: hypothetical protein JF587_24705 [Catenulisporales bacterium]|nr:hypothetical protein [Catenulisporales bacterium]
MNQPVMPRRINHATFDQLFAEGAEAVLSGEHGIEVPPADGGRRWGVSVLLRPEAEAALALEALARDAGAVAGDGHWLTGAAHSSHLTVRALEWPRPGEVPANDPSVARYAAALRTAMADIGSLAFDVVGLTLTRLSVMACAMPVGEAPDRLSAALAEALGEDAWLERGIAFHRSIWYLNLVHFAAPIEPRRARALVDWVAGRRALGPIRVRVAGVEVAAWRFTGTGMTPRRLAAYPAAASVPG